MSVSSSVSVEGCSLAVCQAVGHSSVKSAARMNQAVVIFVDTVEKVNALVESSITVNDAFIPRCRSPHRQSDFV